jgi:FkbM family methyltransferase
MSALPYLYSTLRHFDRGDSAATPSPKSKGPGYTVSFMGPVRKMLRAAKQQGVSRWDAYRLRRRILDIFPRNAAAREEWVVFDVGANIGQTALRACRALRGITRPTVHCFEPFSENYAALCANTRQRSGIRTHRLALGNKQGNMTVPLSAHSQWHSLANQEYWQTLSTRCEQIDVTTLDAFVAREEIPRIAILKTDTEGYDLQVLQGGRSLLGSHRVDVVICEVGFNREDRQHTFFPPVFDFLQECGYRLYLLDDQVATRAEFLGNVPTICYANAWFVSPNMSRPHSSVRR